jgi:hypothetical protein
VAAPSSVSDIGPFFQRMYQHVLEGIGSTLHGKLEPLIVPFPPFSPNAPHSIPCSYTHAGALPNWAAAKIYFGFLIFEGVLAATMPGIKAKVRITLAGPKHKQCRFFIITITNR